MQRRGSGARQGGAGRPWACWACMHVDPAPPVCSLHVSYRTCTVYYVQQLQLARVKPVGGWGIHWRGESHGGYLIVRTPYPNHFYPNLFFITSYRTIFHLCSLFNLHCIQLSIMYGHSRFASCKLPHANTQCISRKDTTFAG